MTHDEIKKLEESFDRYKKALALVYADGDVTSVERNRLISLKNELGLSDSDCMVMEARFHETADQDGIKWEELKDRHHCHLCDSDGKIRWNGIDHSMLEYIELGDTYIEASNGSSYTGLREPFVLSIGQSFEELLDEYGENHIYDAVKDGRLQVFDEQKDLETFLKLKFDILNEEVLLSEYFDSYIHSNEFIEKFGDWEKANRLDKLENDETLTFNDNITVEGVDISDLVYNLRKNFSKSNLKQLSAIANDIGQEVLQKLRNEQGLNEYSIPVITNLDTGKTFKLQMKGIHEVSEHNVFQKGHIEAIRYIPDLIKSSLYIGTEPNNDNRDTSLKQFFYFAKGLKIDESDYTAKIVFAQKSNGELFYDQSLSTIEKGKLVEIIRGKINPSHLTQIIPQDRLGLNIGEELVSSERDEGTTPYVYYDKRLVNICQVPQMPYLEWNIEKGKWEPTIEAVKLVQEGNLYVHKEGQKYSMIFQQEKIPDWEMKYSSLSAEKLISFIGDEAFTKEMAALTLADFEGNGTPLVIDELGNVCEKNIWESKEENAIVDYMPSGILTKEIEIIEDFLTGHTDIPAKQRVEVLKLKDSIEEINDRLIIKEEKSEEQERRSSRSDKEIVKDYLDRIKDNLPPSDRNIVDEVMKASAKALSDFSEDEKKVIGRYLMENGAKDQQSLEKLLKKKVEPENEQEIRRGIEIERGR